MKLPVQYAALPPAVRRAVREEYARRQQGLCWHCGTDLTGPPSREVRQLRINRRLFPATFFSWPVHLHHSRKTGLTVGAVHSRCNAVLWQYHGE